MEELLIDDQEQHMIYQQMHCSPRSPFPDGVPIFDSIDDGNNTLQVMSTDTNAPPGSTRRLMVQFQASTNFYEKMELSTMESVHNIWNTIAEKAKLTRINTLMNRLVKSHLFQKIASTCCVKTMVRVEAYNIFQDAKFMKSRLTSMQKHVFILLQPILWDWIFRSIPPHFVFHHGLTDAFHAFFYLLFLLY